ncbi:MAG: sigma-70 family RNA polymerase sigma factor [Caulobacterales bacterium]|nr:sigma-70 family RNA polymerase sigma factor [Caulobacterales bacterium]
METIAEAFRANAEGLRRFVSRRGAPTALVEDLVQETFLHAYAAKKDEKLVSAKAYLFTVARHLCQREAQARRERFHVLLSEVEESSPEELIDSSVGVDAEVHERMRFECFCQAVLEMPDQCRRVNILRHVYGFSHKEIAARLEIAPSTVEKHIAKGVKLAAAHLRERGYLQEQGAARKRR